MRRIIPILAFMVIASSSYANEPYTLTVPGLGWAVCLNLPPLSQYQAENTENGFRFMGSSKATGIIVSVFVEPFAASNSEACRAEYWTSGLKNPMIVKETVQLLDFGDNPGVSYVLEGELQGKRVKSQNAHVYIANAGSCVDVHLSRFPFTDGARKKLLTIAKTVSLKDLQ